MLNQGVNWQKQARYGLVVLLIAMAYDSLNPGLQPPQVFVGGLHLISGFLGILSFPRRIAVAVAISLAGALIPEMLQVFVPFRDARTTELLARWLITLAGIFIGLIAISLVEKTGPREKT